MLQAPPPCPSWVIMFLGVCVLGGGSSALLLNLPFAHSQVTFTHILGDITFRCNGRFQNMYRWCFEKYNGPYLEHPCFPGILHLAFLWTVKEQGGPVHGALVLRVLIQCFGEVLFPGSIINLLWHRMDDIFCPKHSITRSQQMRQLPTTPGMQCILLLKSDGRLPGSQIRSVTEATDCSALSSLSCNSHCQAAEVRAFLRCWLLRCHGCFLYRMGRGEWGARTAPPTQFSSHGFLPHSPPFS